MWILILSTILLGFLFGSLGVIIGILSTTFDQMSAISSFVIQPLIYLGGVFYSIRLLPALFDLISQFNPMLYVIDFSDMDSWASATSRPHSPLASRLVLLL